jgi:hypothetical protein
MVYPIGKPRRLPHPPTPLPPRQISLLRRNSAGVCYDREPRNPV